MAIAIALICALMATPKAFAQAQRDRALTDPAIPVVAGAYTKLTAHPGVFTTRGELEDLAKRINISGSYTAMRFNKLAAQVGRDLSGQKEWGVAYSGCNSDVYNYGFSYEFQTTHGVDHATQIRTILGLKPDFKPPTGAAVVASRLALYAALVKAGAVAPAGAPSPNQAAVDGALFEFVRQGQNVCQGHAQSLKLSGQPIDFLSLVGCQTRYF